MRKAALVVLLASNAVFAETATPGFREGLGPFVPMLLIFGIFYFLIVRPQQKKGKVQQLFLTQLKRGDMVVTNAGIIGNVKAVSEKIVTLEIDEGVCIKVLKSQIAENASNLKEDAKSKVLEGKTTTV